MGQSREQAQLDIVKRHIAETEGFICRQELMLERLAAQGHNTDDAFATLNALKDVLRAFHEHRRLILAALGAPLLFFPLDQNTGPSH
jgi:hypothetical protein